MWKKLSGQLNESRLLSGKYGKNVLFKDSQGRAYIATRVVPGTGSVFVKVKEHNYNKRKHLEEKMQMQMWGYA